MMGEFSIDDVSSIEINSYDCKIELTNGVNLFLPKDNSSDWVLLKDKMREYYNKEKDPKKAACWLKVIKVMNSMDGTFGGKK